MKIFEFKSQFGWPGDNGLGLTLIEQIKRGEKTATAGPKALYSESELNELYVNVGKPATVIDKDGIAHCNIWLLEVFETEFGAPDERAVFGEGFKTAQEFKDAHLLAWKDLIDSGQLEVSEDTVLVVELFELYKNLDFTFDENLHEVPDCPEDVEQHVKTLLASAKLSVEPLQKAKALGQAGVYLRMLGQLDLALVCLTEAVLFSTEKQFTVNRIRLAHVYQWQKNFEKSNEIFSELLKTEADYSDFIWQHAGKNYFDQGRYAEALVAFEKAMALRVRKNSTAALLASSQYAIEQTQKIIRQALA